MNMQERNGRLTKSALQIRFALAFVASAVISILVHAILLNRSVSALGHMLPNDESVLLNGWPDVLRSHLGLAIVIVVPLSLFVGVLAAFPVAKAVHEFETFLKKVLDGSEGAPCQPTQGAPLEGLCELLNQTTEELRRVVGKEEWNADDECEEAPSLIRDANQQESRTDGSAQST